MFSLSANVSYYFKEFKKPHRIHLIPVIYLSVEGTAMKFF